MEVIDDFVAPKLFEEIQGRMLDYGFPWMWNDFVTKEDNQRMSFSLFILSMLHYQGSLPLTRNTEKYLPHM